MLRVAILIGIAVALSACNPFEDPFLTACEGAIKERLKAPSTYSRVSKTQTTVTPVTDDEYMERYDKRSAEEIEFEWQILDSSKIKPQKYKMYVSYDAANGFGVPIRDTVECTTVTRPNNGDVSFSQYSIELNGEDYGEFVARVAGGLSVELPKKHGRRWFRACYAALLAEPDGSKLPPADSPMREKWNYFEEAGGSTVTIYPTRLGSPYRSATCVFRDGQVVEIKRTALDAPEPKPPKKDWKEILRGVGIPNP